MFTLGYVETAQKPLVTSPAAQAPQLLEDEMALWVELRSHAGSTTLFPKDTVTSLVWASESLSIDSTPSQVALDLLRWQDSGTSSSSVLPTNNFGCLHGFPGFGQVHDPDSL